MTDGDRQLDFYGFTQKNIPEYRPARCLCNLPICVRQVKHTDQVDKSEQRKRNCFESSKTGLTSNKLPEKTREGDSEIEPTFLVDAVFSLGCIRVEREHQRGNQTATLRQECRSNVRSSKSCGSGADFDHEPETQTEIVGPRRDHTLSGSLWHFFPQTSSVGKTLRHLPRDNLFNPHRRQTRRKEGR